VSECSHLMPYLIINPKATEINFEETKQRLLSVLSFIIECDSKESLSTLSLSLQLFLTICVCGFV